MKIKMDISLTDSGLGNKVIDDLKSKYEKYLSVYQRICDIDPMNVDEEILLAYVTTMKLTDSVRVLDSSNVRLHSKQSGHIVKVTQRDVVERINGPSSARKELVELAKLVHKVNKNQISFNKLVERVLVL